MEDYIYQKPLSGFNIGVVFGSFAPLHQGHLDLIMRAKKESDGGCVGIFYEKDGKTLYGIDSNIYKIGWEFYAVFGGDADYDYENELLIKGYEGDSNKKSYSVDEIITIYSNSCV